MDIQTAKTLAEECGFEIAETLDVAGLEFREDVRAMCTPDMCPTGYGRSWSCPPGVASVESMQNQASTFRWGMVVQTVGELEDSYDIEAIEATAKKHAEHFLCLADALSEKTRGDTFALGAGACPRCVACTYPESPCIYPEKMIVSMEASGLLVSQVCQENGMLYYHGPNTITYTSCCLFNE